MSVEKFSGDFDTAIVECPFLGSLGDVALEAMRAEMALIETELLASAGTDITTVSRDVSVGQASHDAADSKDEPVPVVVPQEPTFTDHIHEPMVAFIEPETAAEQENITSPQLSEYINREEKRQTESAIGATDASEQQPDPRIEMAVVPLLQSVVELAKPPLSRRYSRVLRDVPPKARPPELSATKPALKLKPTLHIPTDPSPINYALDIALPQDRGQPAEIINFTTTDLIQKSPEPQPVMQEQDEHSERVAILVEQLYLEPADLYENFAAALSQYALTTKTEQYDSVDSAQETDVPAGDRGVFLQTVAGQLEALEPAAQEDVVETIRGLIGAVHGLELIEERGNPDPDLAAEVEAKLGELCKQLFAELGIPAVSEEDLQWFVTLLRKPDFITLLAGEQSIFSGYIDDSMREVRQVATDDSQWAQPVVAHHGKIGRWFLGLPVAA